MKQLLRNPKARIAVLAVLVVGGAYFLMRGKSAAADPTAGLPVNPTPLGSSSLDPGGMTSGIGDNAAGTTSTDTSGLTSTLQDFMGSVNDRFGHFQDLENAYGDLKAGNNPFGTAADPLAGVDSTGASNPTGKRPIAGDGSAAAPGNAAAAAKATPAAKARFRQIAAGLGVPVAARAGAKAGGGKKKKKRNTAHKPILGTARATVTRSGAVVITRAATPNVATIAAGLRNPAGGGGGYSPPAYAAVPQARAAASVRLPGGGGGYVSPSPLRAANRTTYAPLVVASGGRKALAV